MGNSGVNFESLLPSSVVTSSTTGPFSASSYGGVGSNGAAGQIAEAVEAAVSAIEAGSRGATVYIGAGLWDCKGGGTISGAVAKLPRGLTSTLRIVVDSGARIRLSEN